MLLIQHAGGLQKHAMYTLIGICLLIAVAVLSGKGQRKGAWLLAAVAIVVVIIADRLRWMPWKN